MTDHASSGAHTERTGSDTAGPVESLLDRGRAVADLVSGAAGAVARTVTSTPPVPQVVSSLDVLVDAMPPVGEELALVLHELRAKRSTIRAVQEELSVLDEQLAVLEKALAPLEAWVDRWTRLRSRPDRRT